MSINKLTIVLIYITIFVLLASPSMNLPQNMLEFGIVHIYLFEFPLLAAFALSFIVFLARRQFSIGKNIFNIYGLFFFIAIIGFIGSTIYATVESQTILKDFRNILYWLAGVVLILVGHKYLRLKTLSWVVVAGLLAQFFMSLVMVQADPSILFLNGFRLPGRSGWLTLFFVALVFMMMTYRSRLLAIGKYKIIPITIILVLLLTHVLLSQNRTTWMALSLMTLYWAIFYASFTGKIKFSLVAGIIILLFAIGLQIMPYGDSIKQYLYQRLSYSTLSEEGIKDTWEGNREVIYKSNLADFQKRPIFGNGFGHQMYFDFSSYGIGKEDTSQPGSDNSFINVLVQTGLVGFIIFTLILCKVYFTMKKTLIVTKDCEEWIYLKSMLFVFPFFVLISLNISILYGYPEVIIFSLFFSKAALLSNEVARSKLQGSNRAMANNFPAQGDIK